jgi:hypothetical protein
MLEIVGGILLAFLILAFFAEIVSAAIVLLVLGVGLLVSIGAVLMFKESPAVLLLIIFGAALVLGYDKFIKPVVSKKSIRAKKLFETFSIENKLSNLLRKSDDLLLAGYNATTYEFRNRENQRRGNIPLNGFTIKLYKNISNSSNQYVDSSLGIYIEDTDGREICRYSKVLNKYIFTATSKIEDIQINNLSDELDAFIDKGMAQFKPTIPEKAERSIYDDLNRIKLGKNYVLIGFDLLNKDGISVDKPKIIQKPIRFKVTPCPITNSMELFDSSNLRVARFQDWKWEQCRYKDMISFEYEEQL